MNAPKPKRVSTVGRDEPRTPTRSLPSYGEPTPETHRRLTREDEAEIALKRTVFTKWTAAALIALFLGTLAVVPFIQLVSELRGGRFKGFEPLRNFRHLPRAQDLKAAEKSLETDSIVSQWLLPLTQSVLVGKLRAAGEQVYLGRDGWLFYRPDVDYVTGPPFLSPSQLRRRAHIAEMQPDPVKAIVQFRDQLAARGIELIILPVPTKATLQGEKLSGRVAPNESLQNASFAEFTRKLDAAGVRYFDPAPALRLEKGGPLYLRTDTHWRPETMQVVARQLAASLQLPPTPNAPELRAVALPVDGVGDISGMLKLPGATREAVRIRQVTSGNSLWRPRREADVLLLGDSFSNIFSHEALGWGEAAGFAEQLSYELQRPLDSLLRNSDGAFATREMLANELARGRDRLAGKKLVIWEFAARELAFGNWKLLDLKVGQPAPALIYSPGRGEEIEVSGVVEAVSSVPRPGSVPYAEHVMTVQLADLEWPGHERERLQAVVYLLSMQDNIWTAAARLRPGERVHLRLRAWADVAPRFEQINRSELEDPELQLEEPAWGELAK